MKTNKMSVIVWPAIIGFVSISGCDPQTNVVTAGNGTVIVDTPADQNSSTDPSKVICDPFSGNSEHLGSDLFHGIVANLKYVSSSVGSGYTSVQSYQNFGTPVDATLFFSQLNVPTRKFDLGFSTQTGDIIKNQDNTTLYEYFSIHFETEIQLGSSDVVGPYQFALIADDGATVQINTGSGFQTLINDDGTHPSRLKVSQTPVVFSSPNTSYPLKIDYYQGPRYHIAMMLLWRPWTTTKEPLDGQSGNSLFFDWTQVPSAPTSNFAALLSRGWKVVPEANFLLPPSVAQNPCTVAAPITTSITDITPSTVVTNSTSISFSFASNYTDAVFNCSVDGGALFSCVSSLLLDSFADGDHRFTVYATASGKTDLVGANYSWTVDTTPPQISGLVVTPSSGSFTATWNTNEPSSSALSWGVRGTIDQSLPTNPVLVTQHSMTVTGLSAGVRYSFTVGGSDSVGNTTVSALSGVQVQ